MQRLLYIDAPFGISGDMMAAALMDLGADYGKVEAALAQLPVRGFQTKLSRVKKAGLDMCDFLVELDAAHENHDHDMAYLHGHDHDHEHSHDRGNDHEHSHEHEHEHHHDHNHEHCYEHGHDHGHCYDHEHHHDHEHNHDHSHSHGYEHDHEHYHDHEHRGMSEIREILHSGALSPQAEATALKIFDVLAQAEAKAHGASVDEVHFHEVGAVDSIVDIVTIALCLEDLQLDGVVVDSLTDGRGTIRCQHGIMSVPVPAVTNIVTQNGLKLKLSNVEGELVTPTGAAVAAAICTADKLPANYRIVKSGMGAGKRQYSVPSFLRLLLIETEEAGNQASGTAQLAGDTDTILKLETNIDDCNGEAMGLVMEKLLAAGARDVFFTPIFMKKNRPAYLLSVLCQPEDGEAMEAILFQHTSTIGIRRQLMERHIMEREIRTTTVEGVEVQAKCCKWGSIEKIYPECDSIRLLQEKKGLDYLSAYEMIIRNITKG